ncbi:MAG: beta-lactamase family protein [Gammaproteobacteria bacterium]|nr:beta-lactamase family protein [Gammaproteobacteria bacterium]
MVNVERANPADGWFRLLRQGFFPAWTLLAVAVWAPPVAWSAEIPSVAPEQVGLSSERLERLTGRMNALVEEGAMVGGLGLIARRGRVAYEEVYGQADREAGRPMALDTIFRIYSMSKPITSVAVMMLYEEGEFLLNDPVALYLPELADLQVARSTGDGDASAVGQTRAASRQPTIGDLLKHTAGFTYDFFRQTEVDALYRDAELMTPQQSLEGFTAALGKLPLHNDPGSRWHYSVSVDVQGALVQAVSGLSFGEFLKRRIFDPLGMTDTSFTAPEETWPRIAQLYSPPGAFEEDGASEPTAAGNGLVVADDWVSDGYREGAVFEGGGGGLLSTARDYLRFCQMLLNGGALDGVRLLSPKTVELMTTDHLGGLPMGLAGEGAGYGFGLGFAVAKDQGAIGELGSVGEYSWGGAAGTSFWIDPAEELVGIFMVQVIPPPDRMSTLFQTLAYQAIVD